MARHLIYWCWNHQSNGG